MRQGAGKAKGSAFERDVCKKLSLWITKGRRDDVFWRSAMSGGRATVSAAKGKDMAHVSGDICAVHPEGFPFISEFYVECKFYKDLTFAALVTSNSGLISRFWDKAKEQAKFHDKVPLLILKQNQMPALLGTTVMGEEVLEINRTSLILTEIPQLDLILYNFDEALTHATPVSQQPTSVRPALNVKSKR